MAAKPGSTVFSEITLPTGERLDEALLRLRLAAEQRGVRIVYLLVADNGDMGITGHIFNNEDTLKTLDEFVKFVALGDGKPEKPKPINSFKTN
jgi:hypothetical protein